MAGHGTELADLGVDHREQVLKRVAEDLSVVVVQVVRTGAEADGGGYVPLVVLEDHVSRRTHDEGGVEPAVRELVHPPRSLPRPAMYRPYSLALAPSTSISGPGTFIAFRMNSAIPSSPLPGVVTPWMKYSGQHHEAGRHLPEVTHPRNRSVGTPAPGWRRCPVGCGRPSPRAGSPVPCTSRSDHSCALPYHSGVRSPRSSRIALAVMVPAPAIAPPGWV